MDGVKSINHSGLAETVLFDIVEGQLPFQPAASLAKSIVSLGVAGYPSQKSV